MIQVISYNLSNVDIGIFCALVWFTKMWDSQGIVCFFRNSFQVFFFVTFLGNLITPKVLTFKWCEIHRVVWYNLNQMPLRSKAIYCHPLVFRIFFSFLFFPFLFFSFLLLLPETSTNKEENNYESMKPHLKILRVNSVSLGLEDPLF